VHAVTSRAARRIRSGLGSGLGSANRTALLAVLLVSPLLTVACEGEAEQTAPSLTPVDYASHDLAAPSRAPRLAASGHVPPIAQCNDCHGRFDSFSQFACTDCHLASAVGPVHQGLAGYLFASADCLRCHPQLLAGLSSADHARNFPIGPGTKHNRSCNACHADAADRTNVAKLRCLACHSDPTVFTGPSLAARHSRVLDYPLSNLGPVWCLRCHDLAAVTTIAGHGQQTAPAGSGGPGGRAGPGDGNHSTHCFTCHDTVPPLFRVPTSATGTHPWAQDWKKANCKACHG
jgi:hypothetical protein